MEFESEYGFIISAPSCKCSTREQFAILYDYFAVLLDKSYLTMFT